MTEDQHDMSLELQRLVMVLNADTDIHEEAPERILEPDPDMDGTRCPECSRVFSTPRGCKQHLTATHGYAYEDALVAVGLPLPKGRPPDEPGVYLISNPLNRRCYVGQGKRVDERLRQHRSALESGRHPNLPLQADYYDLVRRGIDYQYEVLLRCKADELDDHERDFIDKYRTLDEGYNLARVGRRDAAAHRRTYRRAAAWALLSHETGLDVLTLGAVVRGIVVAVNLSRKPYSDRLETRLSDQVAAAVAAAFRVSEDDVQYIHATADKDHLW